MTDFASELGRGVKTKHPLDRFVSGFVNKLITHYIEGWLNDCFEKYSEQYFHVKMSEGFNFMTDMRDNHTKKYSAFMRGARAMRHRYDVDQDMIFEAIRIKVHDQGWALYPQEIISIRAEISMLVNEIYS